MEAVRENKALIIVGVLFVALIGILLIGNSDSKDSPEPTQQTAEQTKQSQEQAKSETKDADATPKQANATADTATQPQSYKYVAQPGDSYSQLARKAVQSYGLSNNIQLTKAQIVAAETWLTKAANEPLLNEGQTIQLEVTAVKNSIATAQKLNADELANWEKYVPYVNFDTRHIGE